MSEREKPVREQKIEFYEGPAGGWGASAQRQECAAEEQYPREGRPDAAIRKPARWVRLPGLCNGRTAIMRRRSNSVRTA